MGNDSPRPERLRPIQTERLSLGQWVGVLKRAFDQFRSKQMTDWAATLAYYALMSLVPTILVGVSLLVLIGAESLPREIANQFAHAISEETSGASAEESSKAVRALVENAIDQAKTGAGITLVVGLVLAINGASGAFAAAGRALNRVWHITETRGFVRHKLSDTTTALAFIAMLVVAAALFVTGARVEELLFGEAFTGPLAWIWNLIRFPAGLLIVLVALSMVYHRAPDLALGRSRYKIIRPGSIAALILSIIATGLFALYVTVAGFGSAYGALGSAVVLLFWMWLIAVAFLLGAEIDAELERTHLIEGDAPPAIKFRDLGHSALALRGSLERPGDG